MNGFARRHPILLGALAALAVLLGTGCGYRWWSVGRFTESTDDAFVGGDVTVIATKIPGFIDKVAVSDNQRVHAGDLLVKIDDRDYQAAVAKADSFVAGQQATLANLDAQHELQLAVIAQSRAGLAAAAAEIARTRDDRTRYLELSANAAASVQTFQKADAAYKVAVADEAKARSMLLAAERELDVIGTRKQQTAAALSGALADLRVAQLNLGYAELRSPIDGIVGNRSARPGAYATVGAELLVIVPARGLWVDANFKESQLDHIRPGSAARVKADALPGETLWGHVTSLAPATGAQFSVLPAENATGNFTKIVQRVPVRIVLDGDASVLGRLRPGLSVTAEVDGRTARPPHQGAS